ncbi:MAG: stage II sporulation protein M [Candidatus Kapabacteria bacterium]|nr:stage II sporulation protein M [Candidatus Kapabacteria bacterium]
MREVTFLKQNANKWQRFEELLNDKSSTPNPNELTDLFVEITDDLSYSQTFYNESKTTRYLNTVAARVHQSIYKNKRERFSRFITFWTRELPLIVRSGHRELLVSLIFSLVFAGLGVLSTMKDDRFPRVILGDYYVNMTEANIKAGNPFGVYKEEEGWEMFLRIAFNNVRVTLICFAVGVFFSLGTLYMLFRNAIMLGVFHAMFYQHDLLLKSFGVVWIHGTIEISCIVIAGGAGLIMGNSLLFPKTLSRSDSFRDGALRGMKIVIGLIPLILLAALLESFVTRFDNMPLLLMVFIIAMSASLILWFFGIYPIIVERKATASTQPQLHT